MDAIKKMPNQLNDMSGSHIADLFAAVMEKSPANAAWEATSSQYQPPKAPVHSAPSSDGMRASKGENKHTSANSSSVKCCS
jgi:hypothetical protein